MPFELLAFTPGLFIWLIILFLPWRPWSTRESLDADQSLTNTDLSEVTVLIPARNEAETILQTLNALKHQGNNLQVIVVDDQSTDDTHAVCQQSQLDNLTVVSSQTLADGWSGKLWALEQGRQHVNTRHVLLLDADIVLSEGLIATALAKAKHENIQMLSLMAFLKMQTFWEKLLMPAFIFFFKLLYPFHLANKPGGIIAAAAGGFILIETQVLNQLDGFACIKDALIDDCSLAKKVKQKQHRTWTGMTHSAVSIRNYQTLSTIWHMVSRTAFTQLQHSLLLLVICTLLMLIAFVMPVLALFQDGTVMLVGLTTLLIQFFCYSITLQYYAMPIAYIFSLPLVGGIYLLMTWDSAYRHFFKQGASWKGRHYNS